MRTFGNKAMLALVLGILLSLALACGGGKPVAKSYQGNWVGSDGSTLYMASDGQAGFKIGAKSVDGGGAEIDEAAKTLTISLMGISQTWHIDKEPDEQGEMTLDGTVFKKR